MKLQLKYRALVVDSKQQPVTDEVVYRQISGMADEAAALSTCFERKIPGIEISDAGVSFEYDETACALLAVAAFNTDAQLAEDQLSELAAQTTRLMDRGYYGEDGWFLDIGESSYYVLLVDPDCLAAQPASVVYT